VAGFTPAEIAIHIVGSGSDSEELVEAMQEVMAEEALEDAEDAKVNGPNQVATKQGMEQI
jgi:hypothetical protein